MKTKRLWIARGKRFFIDDIFLDGSQMERNQVGSWNGGSLCQKTTRLLTGLKLKPGQQVECTVTQLKKGFKVEKV